MIRAVINTPSGTLTYQFPDQASAQAWVDSKAPTGMFGKMAKTAVPDLVVSPAVPAVADVPAVVDSTGKIITPAIPGSPAIPAVIIPGSPAVTAEYTVTYTDISAQVAQQAAIKKGLSQQQVGCEIIAAIFALNEAKMVAGTLSVAQLQAMMADPTISLIRELLYAGSLTTAKAMISAYNGIFFTAADVAAILPLLANY